MSDTSMGAQRIRVLMAKVGLDGHDRGVKIVARALRDAGFEVIYTGLHRTPEEVAVAAVQEDVDVIGVSILSGAHMTLVPPLLEALSANDAGDITVLVGGVIPEADRRRLCELGVAAVFDQDATTDAIVDWIRRHAACAEPGGTPCNEPAGGRRHDDVNGSHDQRAPGQ